MAVVIEETELSKTGYCEKCSRWQEKNAFEEFDFELAWEIG